VEGVRVSECCCIYPDGEKATVGRTETRRARKEHVCDECRETIKAGETYEHVTGCWDGEWATFKTCWFCLRIREDFFPCGWNHGCLVEDFIDCNGWDYRDFAWGRS